MVSSSGASTTLTKSYPERRPLVEHLGAELLDVAVHLAQPGGVRIQGLRPLLGERSEHQVGRHVDLLLSGSGQRAYSSGSERPGAAATLVAGKADAR